MKWKFLLLIAVISAAVYANSFHNSFHFDDQHYIVENPYIQDIRNIPSFFSSRGHSSFEKVFTAHYRPLLVTSYAINYAIGGLRPEGYHAVNLMFHAGSAFLVYLILQTMLPSWPSVAAALIFAVHPFNSEAVNYITARSSVMCAFFYLLSFYFWIRFRGPAIKAGAKAWLPYYPGSLLAFILAMLTKEVAITLPVIFLLYDLYFSEGQTEGHKRLPATRYLSYAPFIFLIIAPYLLFRILVYGHIVGGDTRNYVSNFLVQPKVLLNYIQLLFFPYGLTIEHDIRLLDTFFNATVILSFLSVLIILCMVYFLFRLGREWKVLSFFILWFFITLLPTTIIPLNAVLQENRGYLAGIVFAVFAGVCISRLHGRLILPGLAILIIFFSALTVQRNFVWSDDLTLWSDAVAKSPVSARAHDNLGLAYMGKQKYDMALEEFHKTIALNPQYYLAWYNAGVAYQLQGDLEKARLAYEKSLKINPAYFRSYYNAGIVYKKLGELDRAVSSYEKALALDPRHVFVYNNLGVALTEKGDYKKAEDVFKRAVAINPGYEKAYYNLGNLYFREKEYGRAVEAYRTAVRIRPDYKEAEKMLSEAIERIGGSSGDASSFEVLKQVQDDRKK